MPPGASPLTPILAAAASVGTWIRDRFPWSAAEPEDPYAAPLVTGARGSPTVVQLPTVTRPDWTAQSYRSAMFSSDSGLLADAADLCEAMFTDPVYSGVLATRTVGLFGREMQFSHRGRVYQPIINARIDALQKRAASRGDYAAWRNLHNRALLWSVDGCELWSAPADVAAALSPPDPLEALRDDWRTLYPEAELAKLVGWGITLGVGLAERVPMAGRALGERNVPTLRVWHPRWLRYEYYTDTWHVMTMAGEEVIDFGSGRWIGYFPYGAYRAWAHGTWRQCALPYVLKLNAIYDRARQGEVYGSPARIGYRPAGSQPEDGRKMLGDLKRMGRDTAAVYPDGYRLEYVEAKGLTWEIHESAIKWADASYRVALVGQLSTTTEGKGLNGGDSQERTKLDLDRFTNESLATTLQTHGTVHWTADNFPSVDVPRGEWEIDPPEDRLAEAAIIKAIGEGGTATDAWLKGSGKALDAVAVMARFDLPTRELPAGTAPISRVDLGVDAVAAVVRGGPALDSLGLPRFGDDRDDKTIADLLGKLAPPGGLIGAPPGGNHGNVAENGPIAAEHVDPPTDESAAALAQAMTDHVPPVDRCEHGRPNRCPTCGVERERVLIPGVNGAAHSWGVKWRPIVRGAAPVAPAQVAA